MENKITDFTFTVGTLKETVENFEKTCIKNGIDPYNVPVIIKFDDYKFLTERSFIAMPMKKNDMYCGFEIDKGGIYIEKARDSRPENGGEFWQSRGASDCDVSGYVVSKEAGERLRRLVCLLLETDNPKTWLDYREFEPTYIQFKFSADEFDVEMIDKLAKENNDVITEEILRKTMLPLDKKIHCKSCVHCYNCWNDFHTDVTKEWCDFYYKPDYSKKI